MKFFVLTKPFCWTVVLLAAFRCNAVQQGLSGFCWSDWVNQYRGSEGVDLEIFTRVDALQHGVCLKPIAVDYARADGKAVHERVRCNFYGCSCRDEEQDPGILCSDYKVRFLCPCQHNKDSETTTSDEFLCPNGEPRSIKCEGSAIINIKAAYYGNVWISRCGLGSLQSSCREESSKTLEKVALECNGKGSCMLQLQAGNFSGEACSEGSKILHIEYSCEAIALAPGKYSGKIGEIYVDSTCQYKCVFLLSNRAICVPVCPIYYGFECPIGSVIRWRMVPDSYAKQCKCRKPICVDIETRCKVGDAVYSRGERFQLGCEEDCFCLGRNEIKCIPLCQAPYLSCPAHKKIGYISRPTRYKECHCLIAECKDELRQISVD